MTNKMLTIKQNTIMTLQEAIEIAENIKNGERRIDEISLNKAETLLLDANDERASYVHQLKVWKYRHEEFRCGCF